MSVELQELINFHLTGQREPAQDCDSATLYPALLAPFRNLNELRYDFPMLLLDDDSSPAFVDTLTGTTNRLLRKIAPTGNAGEQLRQHVLKLECRIRELVAAGDSGDLEKLWKRAEKSLRAETSGTAREQLNNSLSTARFALQSKGEVIGCDDQLPERVLAHAWQRHEARRAQETLAHISMLAIRLRDTLRVDDLKTAKSRTPEELKKTVGKHFKEAFDFDLMSDLLGDSTPNNHLPAERRKRIRDNLEILEKQRFFATDDDGTNDKPSAYRFRFDSLPGALKAYNERLPAMSDVVKAMTIAELECDNSYSPDQHDEYFASFGPDALTPEDLVLFPSYLVTLHEDECSTLDTARLMEIISCDLPIKTLLQVSDAFGTQPATKVDVHHGSFVQQLAHTLMAPGNAYVLQTTAAYLARHQEQIRQGLEFEGPAVISVFVPSLTEDASLPDYLVAAAALEARTFPAFSYNPAAGNGLADRFDIQHNPDVANDWPVRDLSYEDRELQTVRQQAAFTPADFALTSAALRQHFAVVTGDIDDDKLMPVADYLSSARDGSHDKIPYVLAVGDDNRLVRLVIDEYLVRRMRRCLERWHALQELGGEHNSYVAAAQSEAKVATTPPPGPVADDGEAETDESSGDETDDSSGTVAEKTADATAGDDDPFIETPRCTTCDECTNRNDRMFAYDDNKQAYINDPDAGTYADLVEAAELCQVSIIHPGKPRNPDEPGLEELIERAAPFQL